MYFLGWMGLIAVSLALSLVALAWAFHTGQFADQGRARFLALGDEPAAPPRGERHPLGLWVLAAIASLVCALLASPLVLWLLRPP